MLTLGFRPQVLTGDQRRLAQRNPIDESLISPTCPGMKSCNRLARAYVQTAFDCARTDLPSEQGLPVRSIDGGRRPKKSFKKKIRATTGVFLLIIYVKGVGRSGTAGIMRVGRKRVAP